MIRSERKPQSGTTSSGGCLFETPPQVQETLSVHEGQSVNRSFSRGCSSTVGRSRRNSIRSGKSEHQYIIVLSTERWAGADDEAKKATAAHTGSNAEEGAHWASRRSEHRAEQRATKAAQKRADRVAQGCARDHSHSSGDEGDGSLRNRFAGNSYVAVRDECMPPKS